MNTTGFPHHGPPATPTPDHARTLPREGTITGCAGCRLRRRKAPQQVAGPPRRARHDRHHQPAGQHPCLTCPRHPNLNAAKPGKDPQCPPPRPASTPTAPAAT